MKQPKLNIYRDRKREWRWQVVAPNGRIIADSGEGYQRLRDCTKGLATFIMFLRSWFPVELRPGDLKPFLTVRDAE